MEGGVGEHCVDRSVEVEVEQVEIAQLDPLAEVGELLARKLDHRRGRVDADHPAPRQALGQQPRHPAAAAAGVEHGLAALQLEPLEHLPPPLELRVGNAMVGRCVPVDGHSEVVTGPRSARPEASK